MFLPVFGDPWGDSSYMRVPRSSPFQPHMFEVPFADYSPQYGPFKMPGAEPHCNCRSCVMARSAAAADDLGGRSHPMAHAYHPTHGPRQQRYNQHWQHPQRHHARSPYAHAYARAHAATPYEDADDEMYSDDIDTQQQHHYHQQQHVPIHTEEPYSPYAHASSSRPTSSYASFRPAATFAGARPRLDPEPIAAQYREASPFSVPPAAAAAARATQPPAANHWQQQGIQTSSAPQAPSGKGSQHIKVHAGSDAASIPQHVPVYHAAAQSVPQQQQQQPAASKPAQAARQLSRAEAATMIQAWWRMRRLARQQTALKALATASTQLRSTMAKFKQYTDSSAHGGRSAGHLSHKQYLELNELAMRVLLQLDATSCGVAELRAVRKRLTAAAIKLLDEIQGAYSAAVHSSMELSDSVVQAATQGMAKTAAGDTTKAAEASTAPREPESGQKAMQPQLEGVDAAAQQQQQQQQEGGETDGVTDVAGTTTAPACDWVEGQPTEAEMETGKAGSAGVAQQGLAQPAETQQPATESAAAAQAAVDSVAQDLSAETTTAPAGAAKQVSAPTIAEATTSHSKEAETYEAAVNEAAVLDAPQPAAYTGGCMEVDQAGMQQQQQGQENSGVEGPQQPAQANVCVSPLLTVPAGVRVVFVYPGSTADVATQTG